MSIQINFFLYFAFKRYLNIDLFKQKKDDPLEKVASPPPQLWGELDSPINNHGGYSCDVVSLASCTIFFSHYAYSIAILHSIPKKTN